MVETDAVTFGNFVYSYDNSNSMGIWNDHTPGAEGPLGSLH